MSGAPSKLAQAFERRILLMDGAMGTIIQERDLSAADFGGASSRNSLRLVMLSSLQRSLISPRGDGY